MILSGPEINLVLQYFPKFERSYETMTHKKVHHAEVILAIPEGNKCFAWFTVYKKENVCFVLELNNNNNNNNNNNFRQIRIIKTSFSSKLAHGTIFYGTMFQYNTVNCFCIEDLYFYKGNNYIYSPYLTKLQLLTDILDNELSQNLLNNNFTVFGLPLICSDFTVLLKEIHYLPYKISQIKFRFFQKNNSRKIMTMNYYKPTLHTNNIKSNTNLCIAQKPKHTNSVIFKITADIEPDIYNLFINKDGNDEYYDIVFIPDYKTSVLMNNLFRNIKENDNLDAIEESDDETEFEDDRDDKFVYLNRSCKMNCRYNYKFKKWYPVSLANETDVIVSANQLII